MPVGGIAEIAHISALYDGRGRLWLDTWPLSNWTAKCNRKCNNMGRRSEPAADLQAQPSANCMCSLTCAEIMRPNGSSGSLPVRLVGNSIVTLVISIVTLVTSIVTLLPRSVLNSKM